MRTKIFLAAFLIILVSFLMVLEGCQQVALTGRKQLLLVSDADANALGEQQYREILSKSKISQDPSGTKIVLRVGTRIAQAVNSLARENGLGQYVDGYNWEFHLIDDPKTMNAFCLPGGKIAVYTGILPLTKNDSGLAVVIAHEVAHAVAKHGAERMSQILLMQYGGAQLSDAIKSNPEETQKNVLLAFGIGANVGVLLPYSRLQEIEADRIGLIIMAKAGYDPHEAIVLWNRMKALEGPTPPEFLSTHPVTDERIRSIEAEMPEAMKYFKPVK